MVNYSTTTGDFQCSGTRQQPSVTLIWEEYNPLKRGLKYQVITMEESNPVKYRISCLNYELDKYVLH